MYLHCASAAVRTGEPVMGIKGPTCLSDLITLPTQAPFDAMHLVFQGHPKWIYNELVSNKSCDNNIETSKHCSNKTFGQVVKSLNFDI